MQEVPDDRELLTVAEVAALFRVSRMTITRWADHGQLRPITIRLPSGLRRFRKADIEALLEPAGQA